MSAGSRRLVPWLALSAIVIVLTAVWATRSARRLDEIVATPTNERGFDDVMGEFAKQANEANRASAIDSTLPAAKEAPTSKTGRLQLHVTDAVNGAPLVGATCRVYAERNGPITFGTLTTDADGRASIGELPENTILVHVERRPPYASAFAGVWLKEGQSRALEVKVGAGGTIVGRAVDDTGKPLGDVDVFLVNDKPTTKDMPEVRTSSDGRFELSCVVSRPSTVWIVDDAMRPEFWNAVRMRFAWGEAYGSAEAQIEDGKRVDLGDVVLERPNILSGRVLDARRAPVHNALIAANMSPIQLRREALRARDENASPAPESSRRTQVDGTFELAVPAGTALVAVATVEGILGSFHIEDLASGERRSDLEFILDDVTILELELTDPLGNRVTRRPRNEATQGVRTIAAGIGSDAYLWAKVIWPDGTSIQHSQAADEDDLFRIQLPGPKRAGGKLRIEMPGFSAVDADLDGAVGLVERRKFALLPVPVLHTHLRVIDPKHRSPVKSAPMILLQACLIDPVTFTESAKSNPYFSCCGLGSTFNTPLREFERDVDLPVRSRSERFWIHALVLRADEASTNGLSFRLMQEAHFGPFAGGDTLHAVEITAPDWSAVVQEKSARVPPEASTPTNERVKLDVLDSPHAEKMRLKFIESDGRPVAVGTDITLLTAAGIADRSQRAELFGNPRGEVHDTGGSAAFSEGVRGACAVAVREQREDALLGSLSAYQVVEVDAIETFAERAIQLAPWCTVEIRVSGAAADLPEAALRVILLIQDSPAFLRDEHTRIWLQEASASLNRERRFRAVVAPGNYEIALKSGLFTAPKTSIEVRNEDTLQVFQLSSTRR